MINSYRRAILFHKDAPRIEGVNRWKARGELYSKLVELEGEVFKDGYYKAFIYLAGPCHLCKECAKLEGAPCNFGDKARPAMEACGIDVYQTARNNGFFIETLSDKSETRNSYCLMLVD